MDPDIIIAIHRAKFSECSRKTGFVLNLCRSQDARTGFGGFRLCSRLRLARPAVN